MLLLFLWLLTFFCFFFFFLLSLVSTTVETCRCVHRCTFQLFIRGRLFQCLVAFVTYLSHALSSLQVANAQCMTLRSLAPCLRAAREKHRFAAGKKQRNAKKHVWQQEKNALQREKAVSAAGKNASKKCRFAAGKNQSSRKNTLQQHKSTSAAEKYILEAAGKNRPRREKTRPRQEKNRPRQEKNQQQRKSSFATPKVAATEKIHFRNGKKQQPFSHGGHNTEQHERR